MQPAAYVVEYFKRVKTSSGSAVLTHIVAVAKPN